MNNLQPKNATLKTTEQPVLSFVDVFNQFFLELQVIFPAWRVAFPTTEHLDAAKTQWLQLFLDEGIRTQAQINAGLRRARKAGGEFFPSPSKFLEWSKLTLADFGLPNPDDAYRNAKYCCEAINRGFPVKDNQWLHAAVFHAANQIGFDDVLVIPDDQAARCFERAYKLTCDAVMAGRLLPTIPKAIEHKSTPKKASPEIANIHLSAMRAVLGLRSAA
ncbi:hypothetical protein FK216_15555 [Moraxellaceae bacterium AER2_44_116]|nr:hypothetical protein FK216_15555 [Moraxellaceae bacterium AER2_44_116]